MDRILSVAKLIPLCNAMDNPNEGGKGRESDGVGDVSLGRWETIGSEVVGIICKQQRGSV